MLYEFHTGLAFGKDSWVYRLFSKMPSRIYHMISNRFIDEVPDKLIRRQLLIELTALLRLKIGRDEENVLFRRNMKFQSNIPDSSLQAADAVIGFDTSSWILADRCARLSKKFFLDVSIAHPISKDVVYRQIIKQFPDWKFSLKRKQHKQIAVEEREMELAGHIVVASSFTFSTYASQGIPNGKISINPYGVDADLFRPRADKEKGGKLRFVFVGLVDARKGIPFLLETWNRVGNEKMELTLIGPITAASEKYINKHYPSVILKGKLSFNEVKDLLPDYDVMIFPSFFEGFGLVIPEAMASGLPVITTTATCGPDIIEEGREGFIIEPGNVDQMEKAIAFFTGDPGSISRMGALARAKAEQFSWDAYGNRWSQILNTH